MNNWKRSPAANRLPASFAAREILRRRTAEIGLLTDAQLVERAPALAERIRQSGANSERERRLLDRVAAVVNIAEEAQDADAR